MRKSASIALVQLLDASVAMSKTWVALLVCVGCAATDDLEESSSAVTWPSITPVSPSGVDGYVRYNWGKSIAVDSAGVIHVVWLAAMSNLIDTGADGAVIYQSSTDGGKTFSTPRSIVGGRLGFPKLAVAGTDVHVVWHQTTSTGPQIFIASASAPSYAFTTTQLTTANGALPSIATAGQNIHVAWWAKSPSGVEEIYARSRVNGTWQPITMPSTKDPAGFALQSDGHTSWTPAIAAQGSEVYIAWTDERWNRYNNLAYDCGLQNLRDANGNDLCREEIYFRRSRNNGATWDPEVRVTTGAPQIGNNAPSIAVAAGVVHIAYFSKPVPSDQVWYARSIDDGVTFPLRQQITPTGYSAMRPSVAVSGSTVEIASTMLVPPTGAFLVDAVSTNGGTNFTGEIVPGSNYDAMQPSLTFAPNGQAHMVYVDRDPAATALHRVYFAKR